MNRVTAALVAAASLVLGFAVAQATGVRELGGVVLVAAALLCVQAWRRLAGLRTAAVLVASYLVAFVGSHVLARAIGAWPAVVTVSVAVGVLSLLLVPARERQRALAR